MGKFTGKSSHDRPSRAVGEGMKLVVLQCADYFALKRGWAHPDPHNVIELEKIQADADDTWDDQPREEQADESSIGG